MMALPRRETKRLLPMLMRPSLNWRAEQVLDLESEAGVKFVGEPLPVAIGGVAFVAEQAERPTRSPG